MYEGYSILPQYLGLLTYFELLTKRQTKSGLFKSYNENGISPLELGYLFVRAKCKISTYPETPPKANLI